MRRLRGDLPRAHLGTDPLRHLRAPDARAPGYEIGVPPEILDEFIDLVSEGWGTGISARPFVPCLAGDEAFVRSWARLERFAVNTDVRDVLPLLRVPTLILHRPDDQVTRIDGARYMAERIPGARSS